MREVGGRGGGGLDRCLAGDWKLDSGMRLETIIDTYEQIAD